MTRSRQTADWGSRAGLAKIVPSSVAVGSGTGSASALGTVTFTGVSSLSINDVFSSTYDNYLLVINFNSHSALDKDIRLRMRVSGSDESSAQYFEQYVAFTNANATDNFRTAGGTSFFCSTLDSPTTGAFYSTEYVLRNPFATSATTMFNRINGINNSTGNITTYHGGGVLNTTLSYTGFSFVISQGTVTGTISILGYTQ